MPGFGGSLVSDLASLGFGLGDIDAVILTHSDADHTGLVRMLHDAGARVLIHRDDEPKLRKPGPKSGDASPQHVIPDLWRPSFWRTIIGMAQAQGFRLTKFTDAETFGYGDVLDVPGRPRAVATPGHTPGHTAFQFEAPSALFVGDAMCTLNPISHRRGPQLMPRAMNQSHDQARESLGELEGCEADVMLFGHGEPWRDGVGAAVRQAQGAAQA